LFFDEDIYLDMAKQIVTHFSSCLCDYGDEFNCFRCELMKWPVAHPFLISIAFFLFGISEIVARHFAIFLSSLSTLLVYLSSYLLFRKNEIALFSSLILALLPIHILWSPTMTADLTFSFFVSFLLFFIILSSKSKDLRIQSLSLLALVLATQAKSEGMVLIPLYFLSQFLLNKKYLATFNNKAYSFFVFLSFILLSIYFLHTFYAWRVDTWGASGEKMSFEYLKQNIYPNIGFWFEMSKEKDKWAYEGKQLYHPIFFTLLAFVGIVFLFKENRNVLALLLIWFSSLFLLYSSFYAGSVYYGVDVRYVLPQTIPFSILSGCGAFFLSKILLKVFEKKLALFIIPLIILISFLFYIPKMHITDDKIEESYGARLYRKAAIYFASNFSDDCYFISHVSSIYSWLGKGHLQIWYVYQPEFEEIVNNKCVIFDEGYWCAIKVNESRSCLEFGNKYKLELLQRVVDEKENKVYSFYKVYPKS
jgi:4-amino-4-deoxy-L-arabinose transferase-like glycosyltransferase